jgi:hypothetical protein
MCPAVVVRGDAEARAGAPLLPEVEEVVDLVHRGELAGLVGLGAVLELLEQPALCRCLGFAERRDISDGGVKIGRLARLPVRAM